ncbi:MAG: LacI family DNA-binding transcriptional regulator [Candidatus Dormibacteraeota bacterium]|nr:LacI family DNA-binding transcriptional regulator [Candidatus Dormibacteraeota bacterium]
MKDVADRAGVSIKTVSNVVNGYVHVSPRMRSRVLTAIEELGYRPNLAARSLRHGRVGVIAIEIPTLRLGYFTELAEYVVESAARRGYLVLLDHTGGGRAQEERLARGLQPLLIDGAIMNPLTLAGRDLRAAAAGIPIVLLGEREFPGLYDHVTIDNVAAAKEATEHLLGSGRRRIAALGLDAGPRAGATIQRRWEGFSRTLGEAGVPIEPDWILPGVDRGRVDGLAHARRLLARGGRLPDAFFCFNDTVALGAMRGLHEAGLRVPDDVAVIGFDDLEDGRVATPSLSSISPDKARIADLAVGLLTDRISGRRAGPAEELTVRHRLIARESTLGGSIPA